MPELPEVETIRMQLDQKLRGLRIKNIEVLNKKSFIGNVGDVRDLRVIGVGRRAKITIIELEGGIYLAIHLKLTGQLIFRATEQQNNKASEKYCEQKDGPFAVCGLPNKYTRVIIHFDPPTSGPAGLRRASKLYFNDLRMFGWIKIVQSSKACPEQVEGLKVQSLDEELGLGKFGPEAIDEKTFTSEYFKSILSKTKKPIKVLIMDQEKLAGVGNIYANEALFRAGIIPARPANSLSEKETIALRDSIMSVLEEAIKHGGTSDEDEAYRQTGGEKGKHQDYLQVYGRAGKKCPNCSGIIKRINLGGRGTFFCPKCQK